MNEWTSIFESKVLKTGDRSLNRSSSFDNIAESVQRLRDLLKSKILLLTDINTYPEKFFLAHRIVASNTTNVGPGFWVRLTVQYNLFAGTIIALGTDYHLQQLINIQENGLIGCFCLTEKFAGVHSGLVVNTRAEWNSEENRFILNTLSIDSSKNWISQGLVADKAVVIASLTVNNKHYGIQAFLVDLRSTDGLLPGISVSDMGLKTVGNDLDNALIMFKDFKIPKSALLNKYIDIFDADNVFIKNQLYSSFHVIGQQLFSGRICVAQAALEFRKRLFDNTIMYAQSKSCWTNNGAQKLFSLPHVNDIISQNELNFNICNAYVQHCESKLACFLRRKRIPGKDLSHDIAIAKIKCVEDSIHFVNLLQNEIGSYALMESSGFGQRDFLTCCKFAEGDTRILMQQIAKNQLKKYSKNVLSHNKEINNLCFKILDTNINNQLLIYDLANLIINERVNHKNIYHESKL